MTMTSKELDRVAREIEVAVRQGYDRPPWEEMRQCERQRWEQGAIAAAHALADIEADRPRRKRTVVMDLATPNSTLRERIVARRMEEAG